LQDVTVIANFSSGIQPQVNGELGWFMDDKIFDKIFTAAAPSNSPTQLFEILLFCSVKTGCFVEYNACYVLHFVTAIILHYTKNIYKIFNCKPHPGKQIS